MGNKTSLFPLWIVNKGNGILTKFDWERLDVTMMCEKVMDILCMSDGIKGLGGVLTVPVIVQNNWSFNDSIFAWKISYFVTYLIIMKRDYKVLVNKLPEGRNYT
jgi:hypothetical protein